MALHADASHAGRASVVVGLVTDSHHGHIAGIEPMSVLAALRALALSLPEVTEQPHFDYASFRVRGRIFVTVPPEQTHLHFFVDEAERLLAIEMYGGSVEPLWWGRKIMGVRANLATAPAEALEHLLRAAWRNKAPKRLAAAASVRAPAAADLAMPGDRR